MIVVQNYTTCNMSEMQNMHQTSCYRRENNAYANEDTNFAKYYVVHVGKLATQKLMIINNFNNNYIYFANFIFRDENIPGCQVSVHKTFP